MAQIGYFVEIEMLQNKIKELEQKLNDERAEHRDIFSRMRAQLLETSLNKNEIIQLRAENAALRNELYELLNAKTDAAKILQASMRRVLIA